MFWQIFLDGLVPLSVEIFPSYEIPSAPVHITRDELLGEFTGKHKPCEMSMHTFLSLLQCFFFNQGDL